MAICKLEIVIEIVEKLLSKDLGPCFALLKSSS